MVDTSVSNIIKRMAIMSGNKKQINNASQVAKAP